jgi:hypothetical protein
MATATIFFDYGALLVETTQALRQTAERIERLTPLAVKNSLLFRRQRAEPGQTVNEGAFPCRQRVTRQTRAR